MEFSLYVHIPFCRQKCDYCDFFSIPLKSCLPLPSKEGYVSAVLNEIRFYAARYSVLRWKTVYIGGGTPSQLGDELLYRLISGIKAAVPDKKIDEFTVEVNPEDVTESLLSSLEKAGADRISVGIQALDQIALEKINRHCPVQTALDALNLLKENWHKRLSVDFIAGLPGQSKNSFEEQFNAVFAFENIGHISLYTLTVEENTPLYRNIKSKKIRWSSRKADSLWLSGRELLKKKGFLQYEVSNFAKKGEESLHNKVYWHLENYIGCGSGACGSVFYGFDSQKLSERWTNTRSIREYQDFWLSFKDFPKGELEISEKLREVEKIDLQTQEFEWLMMGFRLLEGVSPEVFRERFGKSLEKRIGAENGIFSQWCGKGLGCVYMDGGKKRYALTEKGIMLLNPFLESLL